MDRIPVFKDAEISEIPSDIFLTPFMQAVKETRKNVKESNNVAVIDKSPSYYNVMNFLDTLTNIQKETPYEVHIAHLHHYTHVYRQATIYRQTEIWHEAQYSSSSSLKSSCLRKSSEESRGKHKKVSFYQMGKEDKSNQVTLCPFHKIKAVRISSQQFPPQSSDEEVYDKICVSNRGDYIKETRSKVDQNENIASKQVLVCKSSNNSETSRKCASFKNIYCAKKQQDSVTDNKHKHVPCKIHGQLNKTSEISNFEIGKISKSEDSSEMTRKCEMSVIGDKSTQVFCQMQAEEKPEENSVVHSVTEDNAYHTSNDEPSLDYPECIEENPDDSKSTEKDFLDNSLMDPFYDYTSENVTPKGVIQKIEGIYEEDNVKLVKNSVETQPKIVVFREVLEVPTPLPPLKSINNLNDIEQYKKRLEKRKEVRLMRKSSAETVMEKISKTRCDDDNVVILKSFYAIIYILMFAALSLDYRCL